MSFIRRKPGHPEEGRRREALEAIVAHLGDKLEMISPTDYRALREAAAEPLPSPATIWEMDQIDVSP